MISGHRRKAVLEILGIYESEIVGKKLGASFTNEKFLNYNSV